MAMIKTSDLVILDHTKVSLCQNLVSSKEETVTREVQKDASANCPFPCSCSCSSPLFTDFCEMQGRPTSLNLSLTVSNVTVSLIFPSRNAKLNLWLFLSYFSVAFRVLLYEMEKRLQEFMQLLKLWKNAIMIQYQNEGVFVVLFVLFNKSYV